METGSLAAFADQELRRLLGKGRGTDRPTRAGWGEEPWGNPAVCLALC